MCYNATTSLGTFAFVAAAAGFLWWRAAPLDHPIALILLVVVAMQLVEWGIWLTGPSCAAAAGFWNGLLTAAIPLLLYAQPLALNAIVAATGSGLAPSNWYAIVARILLVAAPLFLIHLWWTRPALLCTTRHPSSGNLVWPVVLPEPWSTLYYPAMLFPLLTFRDTTFGLLYAFFAAASWLRLRATNSTAWPSVWCHFVNALAAFAVVRPLSGR